MDDEDFRWLAAFNAKAEGSSGDPAQSPIRDGQGHGQMQPPSAGRPSRNKGKEREKGTPAPVFISEDKFEFVMGVIEKYVEENVPMLHTVCSYSKPDQNTSLTEMLTELIPVSCIFGGRIDLFNPNPCVILSEQ